MRAHKQKLGNTCNLARASSISLRHLITCTVAQNEIIGVCSSLLLNTLRESENQSSQQHQMRTPHVHICTD